MSRTATPASSNHSLPRREHFTLVRARPQETDTSASTIPPGISLELHLPPPLTPRVNRISEFGFIADSSAKQAANGAIWMTTVAELPLSFLANQHEAARYNGRQYRQSSFATGAHTLAMLEVAGVMMVPCITGSLN